MASSFGRALTWSRTAAQLVNSRTHCSLADRHVTVNDIAGYEGVCDIVLDRPAARNAIGEQLALPSFVVAPA